MSQTQPRIAGLDAMLAAAANDARPPVDTWDPPHCGDIGMSIDASGTWFYQGSPIGRQRMVKLFSRILRCEPDGSHVLVTPVEKVDVAVADAPFLAVEMDVRGSGRGRTIVFRTNVDDIVTCDEAHPLTCRIDDETGGLKPYVRVRGQLEALLTRSLTHDLVELAERGDDDDAALGIWSGGCWFPIKET